MKRFLLGIIVFSVSLYGGAGFFQDNDANRYQKLMFDFGSGNEWKRLDTEVDGINYGTKGSSDIWKLKGAESFVWKDNGSDITGVTFFYRVYKDESTPPSFSSISIPWQADLGGNNQRWVKEDEDINLLAGVNSAGIWKMEFYYSGSTNGTNCDPTIYWNNSGENYILTFGADASLPVTLESFTATATKAGVLLEWSTSAEIENAGFIIRRQAAGDRNQENGETENGEGNYELPITNDNEAPNSAADHSTNSPSLEGAGGVLLASYLTNNALVGQGSVTKSTHYSFTDSKVEPGKSYVYTLSDVDFSGKETEQKEIKIKTETENAIIAEGYTLRAIYPNPFNASFTVPFSLNENLSVKITLYNIAGQHVMNILNQELSAGNYQFAVNADALGSGVYFVKTNFSGTSSVSQRISDRKSHTQKIVLMK
jgi:hypothetical protein